MYTGLMGYSIYFECNDNQRFVDCLKAYSMYNNFSIVKESPTVFMEKYILEQIPEFKMHYNSFMPMIIVEVGTLVRCSEVKMFFKLKPAITFFVILFSLLAFIIEIILLCNYFFVSFIPVWALLIPLIMIVYIILLSQIGLCISSQSFFKNLYRQMHKQDITISNLKTSFRINM